MSRPAITELPIPSASKKGWPWTEASPRLAETMPDGSIWPRISIVTPSFNQAQFIEETIRSVLLQGYSRLEFIIIDGGSTDGTIEILKNYSPFLTYWHSRKDSGQADAINQGLKMATGEIVAWLNSDDTYLPGTFLKVISLFVKQEVNFSYGNAFFINENSKNMTQYPNQPFAEGWKRMRFWRGWPIPQPTVFFRRSLLERYGYLDETLNFSLDYELFIRFSQGIRFYFLDEFLATYRVHDQTKTGDWAKNKAKFYQEDLRVNLRYAPPLRPTYWPLWMDWLKFEVKTQVQNFLNTGLHHK